MAALFIFLLLGVLGNLHLPALREENICRLDIAMNDVLRVRGSERIS
jgi:hypothetical protein